MALIRIIPMIDKIKKVNEIVWLSSIAFLGV